MSPTLIANTVDAGPRGNTTRQNLRVWVTRLKSHNTERTCPRSCAPWRHRWQTRTRQVSMAYDVFCLHRGVDENIEMPGSRRTRHGTNEEPCPGIRESNSKFNFCRVREPEVHDETSTRTESANRVTRGSLWRKHDGQTERPCSFLSVIDQERSRDWDGRK